MKIFILSLFLVHTLADPVLWFERSKTTQEISLAGTGFGGARVISIKHKTVTTDDTKCTKENSCPADITRDANRWGPFLACRTTDVANGGFNVVDDELVDFLTMDPECIPSGNVEGFDYKDEAGDTQDLSDGATVPDEIPLRSGDQCGEVFDGTNWVTDYKRCGTVGTQCKRQSKHETDPANGNFKDDCEDIPVVHADGSWTDDSSACVAPGSSPECWDTAVFGAAKPQITKTCQGRSGNGLGCDGKAATESDMVENGAVKTVDCAYTKTEDDGKCAINAVYGSWTGACPCAEDVNNPPTQSRTCTPAQFGGTECVEAEKTRVCPKHETKVIPCGTCSYADNCQRKADGSLEPKDTIKSVNGSTEYWYDAANSCDCTSDDAMGVTGNAPYSELTCNV